MTETSTLRASDTPRRYGSRGIYKATLIAGADKRTREYAEYRRLVADLVGQVGGRPSPMEFATIQEAAGLLVWCRRAKLELLNGGPVTKTYPVAVGLVKSLLDRLGLRDVARARLMKG